MRIKQSPSWLRQADVHYVLNFGSPHLSKIDLQWMPAKNPSGANCNESLHVRMRCCFQAKIENKLEAVQLGILVFLLLLMILI